MRTAKVDIFDRVLTELSSEARQEYTGTAVAKTGKYKMSATEYPGSERFRFDDATFVKTGKNSETANAINARVDSNRIILIPDNDRQKEFAYKLAAAYNIPIEERPAKGEVIITVPWELIEC